MSRAVVTGASSGIGREFARRLGTEGVSVVMVGRDRGRLESVAAEVSAAGAAAELVVADLADEAALRALEERLARAKLDLLVNAAGLARFGQVAELERDQSELLVRVNILGLMRLTQAALPGMVARQRCDHQRVVADGVR